MPKPTLYFLIPNTDSFVSGGNIYNKSLLVGLNTIGEKTVIINLAAFEKKINITPNDYLFVDSLYLSEIHKILKINILYSKIYLIVHHLVSLYLPKGINERDYFKKNEFPILKKLDGFVTSSQFTADYLSKNGLTQTKIIIPPAIDFVSQKIPNRNPSPIHALIVANLVERKGILPFLEVLKKHNLSLLNKKLRITIIGSNHIEAEYASECLQFLLKNKDLGKMVFLKGVLSPKEMPEWYKKTNLFISSSFMETYGMALQEAKAFQLPILALKGGNSKNHIEEGENGWIVENMDNLVLQLQLLCNKPSLLEKAIQQNKNNPVSFYGWKDAAKKFMKQLKLSDLSKGRV